MESAAKDYKRALKYHFKHPGNSEYAREVKSLENFFRSGWYGILTSVDGEWLVGEIQRVVRKEVAA